MMKALVTGASSGTVISEQTTESPRPRHNNRLHAPFLHIHYEIYHTAKSPAVPCVDDFFFSQIAKSHPSSLLSPRPQQIGRQGS